MSKKDIPWDALGIPVIVVGVILVIIILVYFIIPFLKLNKKNTNLQQEMVTLAFSNDIQKSVIYMRTRIIRKIKFGLFPF